MKWNKHRSGVYTYLPWRLNLSSFLAVKDSYGWWTLYIYDDRLNEVERFVGETFNKCDRVASKYSALEFEIGGSITWH